MIGNVIKKQRLLRGYSQTELGSILGVAKQTVSNWENDNILPSIEMVIKIAMEFNITTDNLLGLDNRTFIEVKGLTPKQIVHVLNIINDIRGPQK